jgi:hypothetical protein
MTILRLEKSQQQTKGKIVLFSANGTIIANVVANIIQLIKKQYVWQKN